MTEAQKEARKLILYWQMGTAGSFTTHLLNAAGHADMSNKQRLRIGFPELMEAFDEWQRRGDEFLREVRDEN